MQTRLILILTSGGTFACSRQPFSQPTQAIRVVTFLPRWHTQGGRGGGEVTAAISTSKFDAGFWWKWKKVRSPTTPNKTTRICSKRACCAKGSTSSQIPAVFSTRRLDTSLPFLFSDSVVFSSASCQVVVSTRKLHQSGRDLSHVIFHCFAHLPEIHPHAPLLGARPSPKRHACRIAQVPWSTGRPDLLRRMTHQEFFPQDPAPCRDLLCLYHAECGYCRFHGAPARHAK